MTGQPEAHNSFAGQGSVLLDIGGDVGALVVTMPPSLEGVEVEIRPAGAHRHAGPDHHVHHAHVAVVPRPVHDGVVPSLVFPELVQGRWELYEKGTDDVRLVAEIRGGQVSTEAWPE
ncbi:MAG: hypothetical protein JWO11_1820 [Nocardioides sp.]|nr:hypothetical protein [Nocardioides sp.]